MTTGVILITHGGAGAAMLKAVSEKIGVELRDIATIEVALGDTATSVQERIEAAVASLHSEETLFLTDLGGATPFNLCCKKCNGRSAVVTGVNLPMLFKLTTADRSAGARHLAEELVATGTKSILVREGH
jgi:mannose/fructose-specific phosphotransferase system component IIA